MPNDKSSPDEACTIYDKLQRHSFVERHPYGFKLHDKIRELLAERLKFTIAAEHERLTKRLMEYYAMKAGIRILKAAEPQSRDERHANPKYHVDLRNSQGITIGDQSNMAGHFASGQSHTGDSDTPPAHSKKNRKTKNSCSAWRFYHNSARGWIGSTRRAVATLLCGNLEQTRSDSPFVCVIHNRGHGQGRASEDWKARLRE